MKKSELKALLKPLIKECIKESILEEGILSNVIAEVRQGLSSPAPVMESRVERSTKKKQTPQAPAPSVSDRVAEHRKRLMEAIGADAYGGVDLFEGTTPAPGQGSPQKGNPLSGTDPGDAGVDISGIMALGGKNWKNLVG